MDGKQYIEQLCRDAKAASRVLSNYTTVRKNNLLLAIASGLRKRTDYIIEENKKDLAAAEKDGVSTALYDRLLLNRERIESMAVSVEEIAAFSDPVGAHREDYRAAFRHTRRADEDSRRRGCRHL